MPELIEEQEAPKPDFDRWIDLARRRHLYFLVPMFFGWLCVWGLSLVLPAVYKSTTLILVEQPKMPENYVAPNVNENLQDRLQSITQQILSRTRLLTIIDKLSLYSGAKGLKTPDDKIEAMRKDISIELVRDTRNNEITAFKVNFSAHDPVLAQRVTSELTQLFINENLKVREEESEGTTRFIQKQLEDARAALAAQEAKVHTFEAAHEGALPSQQASNLQILAGLQGQLQNQQDSLNAAKQQRVYFQTLIDQYKTLHASGRVSDTESPELAAIEAELSKLRAQLTDLSSRYTDSYPDVQKVKAQIAKTERQRQEILSAAAGSSRQSVTPENTQQLQLQSQLQANQVEIASRERAISSLEGRIAEYQGRLNSEPAIDQQLTDLNRGYEQSKANYDDLLKKKNQSEMATSMERMQQGERFTMLDPPSLPAKPDFPNRMKFCGMGIAAGIALGCLVVFLLELVDDRMHGEKQIKDLLPFSLMAEIPEVKTPQQEEMEKRHTVVVWAMTATVVVLIAIGSAYSYLRG